MQLLTVLTKGHDWQFLDLSQAEKRLAIVEATCLAVLKPGFVFAFVWHYIDPT